MEKDNDGGSDSTPHHPDGISLRDYFAAVALQGMLAKPEGRGTCKKFSIWAYQYADAMLIEREK